MRVLKAICIAGLGAFLATSPADAQAGARTATVSGIAPNDVLNLRSGPSTRYGIVGALGNGDTVRVRVCESHGRATWCRIRLPGDMGGEGWVNARYLDFRGTATQLPEAVPGDTQTVRVRFAPGTSGTELTGQVAPGGSVRYVIGARNGQFLYARVAGRGLEYQVFNPNGTFLLDMIPVAQEYRGQLWQSGDHVIEVINRGNRTRSFNIIIGID